MKKFMLICFTLLSSGLASIANVGKENQDSIPVPSQRYYFAASSFDGGASRARLRYSNSDAELMGQVLRELGGTEKSREELLVEPSPSQFKAGLEDLASKMRAEKGKARQEVIVYYSGHADENGLILKGGNLAWKELRQVVQNMPADLRLSVIDACGSGAIVRSKGGLRRQAFLNDKDENLKGTAFLTSSSESEVSQESDRLRASFFTHALISGLRGAADFNGDHKVTLSEAYQYAFQQTMEATEAAQVGQQHPLRDIDLSGSGDLVLTDLDQLQSGLVLGSDLHGLFWVYDPQNKLVAGVQKSPGRTLQLGLEPGNYQLRSETLTGSVQASLVLESGQTKLIDSATLIGLSPAQVKADDLGTNQAVIENKKSEVQVAISTDPWHLCDVQRDRLSKSPSRSVWDWVNPHANKPIKGFQGSLLIAEADSIGSGFQFGGLGAAIANDGWSGLQLALVFNRAKNCMEGTQISDALNFAETLQGAQIGFLNFANDVRGLQLGTFNYADHRLIGSQIALVNLASVTSNFDGDTNANQDRAVQVGLVNLGRLMSAQVGIFNSVKQSDAQVGLTNLSQRSDFQGGLVNLAQNNPVQIGLVNLVENNEIQVSLMNLAMDNTIQAGLLNIAKKTKIQVGLLNLADTVDLAFGLINISKNGIEEFTAATDETGKRIYGFRSGSSRFYTHLLVSESSIQDGLFWNRDSIRVNLSFTGFGIGTRFGSLRSWWPQLEYQSMFYALDRGKDLRIFDLGDQDQFNQLHRINFDIGWNPIPVVGLSAGLGFNLLNTFGNVQMIRPRGNYQFNVGGRDVLAWPGIHAELRVGLNGPSMWSF